MSAAPWIVASVLMVPARSNDGGVLYNRDALISQSGASPLLVFVHIPKCAGDSFFRAARIISSSAVMSLQWFPGHGVPDRLGRPILATECAPDASRGTQCKPRHSWNAPGCGENPWGGTHCGFAELSACIAAGSATMPVNSASPLTAGARAIEQRFDAPRYVTVIRDPAERVVSEYLWWRKKCKGGRQSDWRSELCSAAGGGGGNPLVHFRAWLESPYNNAANRMTRMLADVPGGFNPAAPGECISYDPQKQEAFWGERYNNTAYGAGLAAAINADTALAENAIANLERHFAFAALQEHFNRSLVLLGSLLGAPAASRPSLSSLGRSHSSVRKGMGAKMAHRDLLADQSTVSTILATNRLDALLYTALEKRFEAAWDKL